VVYFMSIEKARFRKPAFPEDRLYLHIDKQQRRGKIWKFKGEEYLRQSGLSYSIVRAGGLKPEIPGGQYGVYLSQGDDSRAGQISIEDVASVLIQAANNPEAHGKTYETFNYVTRYPEAWPDTFAILHRD